MTTETKRRELIANGLMATVRLLTGRMNEAENDAKIYEAIQQAIEDAAGPADDYVPAESDPALYRQLSEPFEDAEEADEAFERFFNEVGRARKKHGFADVMVIAGVSISGEGRDPERESIAMAHLGNTMNREAMAAYALGKAQQERESLISTILGKSKFQDIKRRR